MVDFVLSSGKMHADVHWKRTSRAVFHLPDGGGPDSCTQWPTGPDELAPECCPTSPVCLWWGHQLENAGCAVLVVTQLVLSCLNFAVEGSGVSCGEEPVAAEDTPAGDTRMTVLPYHQVTFNLDFLSREERFVVFHLIFNKSHEHFWLLAFSYSTRTLM